MARGDVIAFTPDLFTGNTLQSAYPVVRPSNGDIYIFYVDLDSANIHYVKSTDNGFTWSDAIAVATGSNQGLSVWYDRWSGIAADVVHLAYIEAAADDVFYRSLDLATDSLGTETTISTLTSASLATSTCISITRARGGNILCGFDADGGTETGFFRSTDAGATWGSRSNLNEATSDYYLLAPGFAADNQDIMAIFWDRSADEISRKVYDDSADSWAETSIAASMTDVASNVCQPQFGLSPDLSNSRLLVVAWSNADTLNADLRFWTVTEAAITEGTNVVTDSVDDQRMCAIALETDTDDIYVFYGGKSDGSETAGTAIGIYYKLSTDTGTTWGSETALSNLIVNCNVLLAAPRFQGGEMAVTYQYTTAVSGVGMGIHSSQLAAGAATPVTTAYTFVT